MANSADAETCYLLFVSFIKFCLVLFINYNREPLVFYNFKKNSKIFLIFSLIYLKIWEMISYKFWNFFLKIITLGVNMTYIIFIQILTKIFFR